MSSWVRTERVGEVEIWTVDRPAARNAIDDEVSRALLHCAEEAERDDTLRAVILTGSGDSTFLSGADLKLLSSGPPALRASVDAQVLALLQRIEALPLPVIAALNGSVFGGGCEVALACDLRIGEAHTSVTFRHAAMSVTPGWGGFARLCRTVGRGAAAKLLLTALPLSAEEALRVGFLDEVVPRGGARERALEIAQAVERTSPSAVADMKRLLALGYAGQLTLEEEQRTFLARSESADHREALRAYLEKRPPAFGPRT